MTFWRSVWSAITQNRLMAVFIAVVALSVMFALTERVMTHNYGLRVQWSDHGQIELAPPPSAMPPPASSAITSQR